MFEFAWMMPLYNADGAIGGAPVAPAAAEPAPAPASATPAPASTPAVPPSVAAGGNEPPASGNAPAAGTAPAGEPAQPDVAQQASFASRLKEERGKIETEFQPYRERATQIESIAKAAGFPTAEAYLQALDKSVRDQRAAEEAKRLGVDPETYKQFFAPVHEQLTQTQTELQTLRQAEVVRQVQADDQRLNSTYPDYNELRDQVFQVAEQRVLPLEDAYKLVSWEARQEKARLEGQNAAVAAMSANAATSTGPVGGDAPSQAFDFTKLSPEQRQQYYEKAKRGELKSLH